MMSGTRTDRLVSEQSHVADLVALFNAEFGGTDRTELIRGQAEPLYIPSDSSDAPHRIVFAHGFFASALHEVAHWCIAGASRRRLPDYGYWYQPMGRTTEQQRAFEQVEIKPQALEWIFSKAAGRAFHFSPDNLDAANLMTSMAWTRFQENVVLQIYRYIDDGLPPRAERFVQGLSAKYGTAEHWRDKALYGLSAH